MNHIYLPSKNAGNWKQFLADPETQWRTGYSARTLAYCWEDATGFPSEIMRLFSESDVPAFKTVELLLTLPEFTVSLPGGGHASQNDLFVLAKAGDALLISMVVEGKVSEPFGPTVGEWKRDASAGKAARLEFIQQRLGLTASLPDSIRYQLLHRTVASLLEAQRFNCRYAVMVVHSFSQTDEHFGDYRSFLSLFGVNGEPSRLLRLGEIQGISLYAGWARGDAKYLGT